MAALELNVESREGKRLLTVRGEVDMESSPQLLRSFEEELGASRHLFVDMTGVSYCDSSGIATLVRGHQLAQQNAVRLVLDQVSDSVRSVIDLASLGEFFEFGSGSGAS